MHSSAAVGHLKQAGETDLDDEQLINLLQHWKLLPNGHTNGILSGAIANYLEGSVKSDKPVKIFHSGSGSNAWLAGVKKLDWDSNFFGFGVGRLEPLVSPESPSLNEDALQAGGRLISTCVEYSRRADIKQLSAQAHSSDTTIHLALQQAGFFLMDTIVTYEMPILATRASDHFASIRAAGESDLTELAQISADCFSDKRYNVNRFNSDPQFPAEKVKAMYALWLENSLNGRLADRVFTFIDQGKPVGFITVTLPTEADKRLGINLGRIPLNAVHPQYHRSGIYTKLVKTALHWLCEQGAERVEIKTQLPNSGVHRAWSRLGASIIYSFHTFHLNLL